MVVDVFGRGGRRHQRHVVEGREQNAAIHGVEMHEAFEFEVHGIVRFGSVLGSVGAEQILGAATEARDVPGQAEFLRRLFARLRSSAPPWGSCGRRPLWSELL